MSDQKWPLTGVVDPAVCQLPDHISDARWQQAVDIIRAQLNREPDAAFRASLDRALLTYHAMSALSRESPPKKVRARLKRLLNATTKLNDALNELDGTSAHFINDASVLNLSEMRHNIGDFINTTSKALSAAEQLARRGRLVDLAVLNMGSELADAVAEHFGHETVVSTEGSLFVGLLEALLHEATGKEPEESGKAVLRVLKFWRAGHRT